MDCIMRKIEITLLLFFMLLIFSCASIYKGGFKQPDLNKVQPNNLGPLVLKWEDGVRTSGKSNEFEWWYFDTQLSDGSMVVCYFYKIHFFRDRYFIGLNYNSIESEDIFKLKYFDRDDVSFSKDSCSVIMGNNYLKGNLDKYEIFIDPNDFEGFGVSLILDSKLQPFRPQDGIIKAGNQFFAWLAAVPDGETSGFVTVGNKSREVSGDGYHDHNWGNTPLQKLFKSWTWFRGKVGEYTIIASELNLSEQRGDYNIPILYMANQDTVLINRYANDGLFTKYNNVIENLYNPKNENLYSEFDLMTVDNILIKIKGKKVIDNSDIFERMSLPRPLRWVMYQSKIDPYYTRFKSSVSMKIPNKKEIQGYGVLEIMDLQ